MSTELFGLFDGPDELERVRDPERFDAVVEGNGVTVGVSDDAIGAPNRTSVHEAPDGCCVVFGELYPPGSSGMHPARWAYRTYRERGRSAFDDFNGSYVVVIEHEGDVRVVTDQLRSRECFYTDEDPRVFGTDSVAVARTMGDRSTDHPSLLEFLYLSTVLGTDTLCERLERVPFDGALRPDGVETLDRFVYRRDSFDHVTALADALDRAIDRRAPSADATGLLLSAGYDSRAVLASGDVDVAYTVGEPGAPEVDAAERLAAQYGADHVTLPPDDRYLNTDPELCRYTDGIRESVHIHHAGYEAEMPAPVMLHGWAFDSLLREHFVPHRTVTVQDKVIPMNRLDTRFDPVEFATRKFGYLPEAADVHDRFRANGLVETDPEAFVDATIHEEFEACRRPGESVHNTANRFGVKNLPSLTFRSHLADRFRESFVAADVDLVTWHLRTPPEHRTTSTYRSALRLLDEDILRVRPPDRPHDRFIANQVEGFLRRIVPGVESFGTPWPNRRELYDRNRLDEVLFGDQPRVHHHSPRFKLRLHDALCWLDAVDADAGAPEEPLLGEQSVQ